MGEEVSKLGKGGRAGAASNVSLLALTIDGLGRGRSSGFAKMMDRFWEAPTAL